MKALLLQRDAAIARRISRLWRAAGLDVIALDDPEKAKASIDSVNIIGADEFDRDFVLETLSKNAETRAVLWTTEPITRLLPLIGEQPRITSVLGRPGFDTTPADWELMLVAHRLQFPDDSPVPASALVRWGSTGFNEHVTDTDGIDKATTRVGNYVDQLGMPSWVRDMFAELAHELLMNAIYDAPVDRDGQPRFAHDRKTKVRLVPEEAATLRLACDGVLLCIQVVDPFGRLERKHVVGGLARGLNGGEMDQRGGGAGLGIALCHQSTLAMIYDVVPQESTEVTGVFELDLNRRDFRNRARSLHFFERSGRSS